MSTKQAKANGQKKGAKDDAKDISTPADGTNKGKQEDKKKDEAQQAEMRRKEHYDKILKLHDSKLAASEESQQIIEQIKDLYKSQLLPLENKYFLNSLCMPTYGPLQDAELDARPMVLLLGQYSTGKTSFIRHLLGQDFPSMHIDPEPTSDKFTALIHGKDKKIIKGNTLTVMPELPFFGLGQKFGTQFCNNFHGSVTDSPLLEFMNIVDTPGILSGEKQRLSREYPFSSTAKWFADRSDLILLLFDAHKLDISDEFKHVVETIRPHNDDKIRCILNKADTVAKEPLVRVYGSLMWSMGKLFSTPEVIRVYTGSFWDQPLQHDDFEDMFQKDESWLLDELMRLPSVSAERKVNAVVKRIRLAKVHLCVLGYIKQQMPLFNKAAKRKYLLDNLDQVFATVKRMYVLPEGDMPKVQEFRDRLSAFDDFSVFPNLQMADLDRLERILSQDLPKILKGHTHVTELQKPKSKNSSSGPLSSDNDTTTTKAGLLARSNSQVGMILLSNFGQFLTNLVFLAILVAILLAILKPHQDAIKEYLSFLQ